MSAAGYVPDWDLIFKMVATIGSLAAMLGVYLMFRSNRLAEQAVELQQQERKGSALSIEIDDLEVWMLRQIPGGVFRIMMNNGFLLGGALSGRHIGGETPEANPIRSALHGLATKGLIDSVIQFGPAITMTDDGWTVLRAEAGRMVNEPAELTTPRTRTG